MKTWAPDASTPIALNPETVKSFFVGKVPGVISVTIVANSPKSKPPVKLTRGTNTFLFGAIELTWVTSVGSKAALSGATPESESMAVSAEIPVDEFALGTVLTDTPPGAIDTVPIREVILVIPAGNVPEEIIFRVAVTGWSMNCTVTGGDEVMVPALAVTSMLPAVLLLSVTVAMPALVREVLDDRAPPVPVLVKVTMVPSGTSLAPSPSPNPNRVTSAERVTGPWFLVIPWSWSALRVTVAGLSRLAKIT